MVLGSWCVAEETAGGNPKQDAYSAIIGYIQG